jgi:hypothetical protein
MAMEPLAGPDSPAWVAVAIWFNGVSALLAKRQTCHACLPLILRKAGDFCVNLLAFKEQLFCLANYMHSGLQGYPKKSENCNPADHDASSPEDDSPG